MFSKKKRKADLYSILGVSPTASQAEIKKAYRALAKQHHPDLNPGCAKSAKAMEEINHAFGVLSDETTRAAYDATGNVAPLKSKEAFIKDVILIIQEGYITVLREVFVKKKISPKFKNILPEIRAWLDEERKQSLEDKHLFQKTKEESEELSKRITHKGRQDPFLLGVIDDAILQAERNLKLIEETLEIIKYARDHLNEYACKIERKSDVEQMQENFQALIGSQGPRFLR